VSRELCLALSVAFLLPLAPASSQQSGKVESALVYKPDGTRHCEATQGESLDSMAAELIGSDIAVHSRRKSHDGREGIAVCGSPTGGINVYEIDQSDLPLASQLGFQRLDPSWFDVR